MSKDYQKLFKTPHTHNMAGRLSARIELPFVKQILQILADSSSRFTPSFQGIHFYPTYTGWLFVVVLLLQYMAAVNYGNNVIYAYAFLHFSIFIFVPFFNYRHCRKITIRSALPQLIEATRSCPIEISVTHEQPGLVTIKGGSSRVVVHVTPGKKSKTQLTHIFATRGITTAPAITIETTTPFGFYKAVKRYKDTQPIYCYPKPVGMPLTAQEAGPTHTMHGDEFLSYRPAQDSDPRSRIDWKLFARSKKVYLKQFSALSDIDTLVFDYDSVAGDAESRLRQLSLWIHEAQLLDLPYQLILQNQFDSRGSGEFHAAQCLMALAAFKVS